MDAMGTDSPAAHATAWSRNPLATGAAADQPGAMAAEPAEGQADLERALGPDAAAAVTDFLASREKAMEVRLLTPGPGSRFEAGVRNVFGRLTEAPANMHQVTVFAASTESNADADLRRRTPLLLAVSVVIVFAQCATVSAVVNGTLQPSCKQNDQCERSGTFCSLRGFSRCVYCGSHAPLDPEYLPNGDALNDGQSDRFAGINETLAAEVCADFSLSGGKEWLPRVGCKFGMRGDCFTPGDGRPIEPAYVTAWCDRCLSPVTGSVDVLTGFTAATETIESMSFSDWCEPRGSRPRQPPCFSRL
eukprot:SAG22_NODE_45_length_24718_cov_12.462448_8_plen_304_part_00